MPLAELRQTLKLMHQSSMPYRRATRKKRV